MARLVVEISAIGRYKLPREFSRKVPLASEDAYPVGTMKSETSLDTEAFDILLGFPREFQDNKEILLWKK